MKLWFDTETFCTTPIAHGLYRYMEEVELMVATWAIDEGPVQLWDATAGEGMPAALTGALFEADEIWAHNAMFDRNVMRARLPFELPIEKWRCVMVKAMAHGMPGGLGVLGPIVGVPGDQHKDKVGHELIQLFCKPRPKNQKLRRATRDTHPNDWARFLEYAAQDIVTMREVARRIPSWNYKDVELALWHLDQKINDRGYRIDLPLVAAAQHAIDIEQEKLSAHTDMMTSGEVQTMGQRDALLAHVIESYGVFLPDLKASTLERRVGDPDLPQGLRDLIAIRLQATTTSTAKYRSLARGVSSDGRLRGTLQFAGAGRTRRWSGRTFQPQNLPSRGLPPQEEIALGIEALKLGAADLVVPDVMKFASAAIRGTIIPGKGKKFCVADLSNIEGRDQAWLAGEEWKLQAFRDFDAGTGPDLYKLAYAKSFQISHVEVDSDQRQIGKVMELAFGYQGRVNAWVTFSLVYGIDLEELARVAWDVIPEEMKIESREFRDWWLGQDRDDFGLSQEAFIVCNSFAVLWRRANSAISSYWPELEAIAIDAVNSPGQTFTARKIKVRRDGEWLRLGLPSGRSLCYPHPEMHKGKLTYMGTNQYTRKWQRLYTYGGKLFENCLTADTQVLTRAGWRSITEIGASTQVWDGSNWVRSRGCVYRGNKLTLSTWGVRSTPEHLFLTSEGWQGASSCEGHYRAASGLPHGAALGWLEWAQVLMGSAVRLRQSSRACRYGTLETEETRRGRLLRLSEEGHREPQADSARDVAPPRVCRVAQHVGPLRAAVSSGLEKLWGARDNCLHQVAELIRGFLGRYGADVSEGLYARTVAQFSRLFRWQLCLAHPPAPSKQYPEDTLSGHPPREDVGERSGAVLRPGAQHSGLPLNGRVASSPRPEPVYDLVDCGPNNRFVVRGGRGEMVIVHNCCQALARDVMADNMLHIEAAGYPLVLTVHDEVICETPDTDDFTAAGLVDLLAANPPWAPDMPLAAKGFECYRYKKG